jgi:hypothetical protein
VSSSSISFKNSVKISVVDSRSNELEAVLAELLSVTRGTA